MNPQEPGDRMLDRESDSTLSKIYKGTTSEAPTSELDAAVLGEARRAAEAHAFMLRRRTLQRWMIPTSLAAALVLTVGLVTFVSEHGGAPLTPKAPMAQRPRPAELPAPEAPRQQPGETTRQPQSGSANEQVPGKQTDTLRSNVPMRSTSPSQAMKPVTSAPAKTTLLKEEAKREQPQVDKTGKTNERAPAGAAAEAALSPQEWLKQIAELRKQGRLSEAQASFAEFRRRHPDYPVETILK
jgi:hypothetical protein